MGLRIGADVGGTFTDIVIELDDGTYASTKVLTTHTAPEIGILDGIARIADQEGVSLADVEQIIHGTTLATNALIERRGAKTALVTTDGFRDVIETRTESRFEQYDLNIVLPAPLIARADRHVVASFDEPPRIRNQTSSTAAALMATSATLKIPVRTGPIPTFMKSRT